jgi:hypothetical protein
MDLNLKIPRLGEPLLSPVGTHQTVTLGGSAFSPANVPAAATHLMVQALAQNARYTLGGTTPTAAIGFQLLTTAEPLIIPLSAQMKPTFFRESSGTILQYQLFGMAT